MCDKEFDVHIYMLQLVVSHNTIMMKLDLPSPIIIKQHLLEDKKGEDENRNVQAAIKQDYYQIQQQLFNQDAEMRGTLFSSE